MLTEEQIRFILALLREKYGFGYSADPAVGALQAKLSVMLEVQARLKGGG